MDIEDKDIELKSEEIQEILSRPASCTDTMGNYCILYGHFFSVYRRMFLFVS